MHIGGGAVRVDLGEPAAEIRIRRLECACARQRVVGREVMKRGGLARDVVRGLAEGVL
jgi:hypothetical protein